MPCGCCLKTYKVEPQDTLDKEGFRKHKPCPEDSANFISRLLFAWVTGLIVSGYRRPLKFEDLYDVRPIDRCDKAVERLEKQWEKQIIKTGWQVIKPRGQAGDTPPLTNGSLGHDPGDNPPPVAVQAGQASPSLWMVLFGAFGLNFFAAVFLKLMAELFPFVSTQILSLLLNHMTDPDDPSWKGYMFVGILFGFNIIRTLLYHLALHIGFRTGMHARNAFVGAVFRKALRLSSGARRSTTVGEIVNLMAVDAQRIQEATAYQHALWTSPILLLVALGLAWRELGPSTLAGFIVMMFLLPINSAIGVKLRKLQVLQMHRKDDRIKMTNEILNGIKVLKMYAWETPFTEYLLGIRRAELKMLKGICYCGAAIALSCTLTPYLIALASFACFVMVSDDNILTAHKALVSLALFELTTIPLSILPNAIAEFVQIKVAVSRLKKFLKSEELDPANAGCRENEDAAIRITNGTFAWALEDAPVISDISLCVPAGKLVAVVGQVGAGKSSLISAILGEMHVQQGDVHVKGSVAYVPQQAWIRNASLRSNILFGRAFQKDLYNTTIETCALDPDLKILPAGDLTEIGEKGINLSGGQKQRVSLGRAVYQNHDIYLLDDPLSAVDAHVGKHIFGKVIGPEGTLRSKTRILVTNSLWVLPLVDEIIVLNEGRVTEQGTYKDLIHDDGDFAEFCATYLSEQMEDEDEAHDVSEMRRVLIRRVSSIAMSKKAALERTRRSIRERRRNLMTEDNLRASQRYIRASQRKLGGLTGEENFCRLADKEKYLAAQRAKQGNRLIQIEHEQTGSVSAKVFRLYCRACGMYPSFCVFAFTLLAMGARVVTNVWLSEWSNDFTANYTTLSQIEMDQQRNVRLGVYGALGCGQAFFTILQAIAVSIACLNASSAFHGQLLRSMVRAPMSFFDTTPLGRILNRFSKDMDTIDLLMPRRIRLFLETFSGVFTTLIIISYSSPLFLIALLPIGSIFFFTQRVYVASSRQLKRIDATRRSPIFTNFGESVVGADSVRAYAKQVQFIEQCDDLVNQNNMAYYASICLHRWLGVCLEMIGSLILLVAAVSVVAQRGTINTGNAGLSIAFVLQISVVLGDMARDMATLEENVVAAERIHEYLDIESEAPNVIEDNRVPTEWPTEGRVEIKNYSLRYRAGLDLILKGVNCNIKPGEKVGIVGRTGAGKSSLTLGLFRIIEAAGGRILIDGKDIASLGLQDLRSRLTIIPQDPVVFSGSLRINLDPYQTKRDEEIWDVLEQAYMKDFVRALPGQLEFKCSEGGDNISVGQRQLICLARALIRKTRILVLDEATAAMDVATDDHIQNTIRTQFQGCTVLTIAHRLNTILDYDRVLVLDKGEVAEIGGVEQLMTKEDGLLRAMMLDAGLLKAEQNKEAGEPELKIEGDKLTEHIRESGDNSTEKVGQTGKEE